MGTGGTGTGGTGTGGTGTGGTSTGKGGTGTGGTGTGGTATGGTGTGGAGTGGTGTGGSGTGGTGTGGSGTGGAGTGGTGTGGTGTGGTGTGGSGTGGGGTGGGGPCTTAPGACVASLPAGWTLAAYEASRAASCPTGFTQADVVAAPVAGAGACDCGCAFNSSPTCTKGMVPTQYGLTGCGLTGATLNVDGTGCTKLGFSGNLSTHFSATPAAATGLACTASTTTDLAKVTSTDERLCLAPTMCEEDVCGGMVDPGFSACVVHDGDQACPSGWPTKTTVGDSATLACAACTGCTGTADCTDEKVQFFSDQNCNNAGPTLDANGTCVSSNGSLVTAFKYTATVANQQCKGTGPKTASVGLAATRTVCCK